MVQMKKCLKHLNMMNNGSDETMEIIRYQIADAHGTKAVTNSIGAMSVRMIVIVIRISVIMLDERCGR